MAVCVVVGVHELRSQLGPVLDYTQSAAELLLAGGSPMYILPSLFPVSLWLQLVPSTCTLPRRAYIINFLRELIGKFITVSE